jgi:hypothetical protein
MEIALMERDITGLRGMERGGALFGLAIIEDQIGGRCKGEKRGNYRFFIID